MEQDKQSKEVGMVDESNNRPIRWNGSLCSFVPEGDKIEWCVNPIPSIGFREIDENGVLLPKGEKSRFAMTSEDALKESERRAIKYLKRHAFMIVSCHPSFNGAIYTHNLLKDEDL